MPLTEDEKKQIDEELQKMFDRDKKAKPIRKARKEYINDPNITLRDLLYNDVNGKRIPLSTDIVQSPDDHISFVIKGYGIGDCSLLADLIHLAKTNPKFIMKDLINSDNSNPNRVKINLFECKYDLKFFQNHYKSVTIYPKVSRKVTFEVTKDEAIKWKSAHKAFWPIVIEIAYSKFLDSLDLPKHGPLFNEFEAALLDLMRNDGYDLMSIQRRLMSSKSLMISNISATQTVLTGKPTKVKSLYCEDTPHKTPYAINSLAKKRSVKSFRSEYSREALHLYDKIKNKLDMGKMVGISFKDKQNKTLPLYETPEQIMKFLKFIKANGQYHLNEPLPFSGVKILTKDFLTMSTQEQLKILGKLLANNGIDKLSKSKVGIVSGHQYVVVGYREQPDGYKYIIIADPSGTLTKIDYEKKIAKYRAEGELPRGVKITTPQGIDNAHGECAIELNHLYKKISSLDYEYDPEEQREKTEEKMYEALRKLFN